MKAFRFVRPKDCGQAADMLAKHEGAVVHAGGVDLLDRLKERLVTPDTLVSLVDAEGLGEIQIGEDGAIRIGAKVTLAQLASSRACKRFLPTLAQAAARAASPQIRNRATIAGNIAQQNRCGCFRLETFPCFRRGGEDCPVRKDGGVQENAAIFDGDCVCSHPSSLAPVLGSLDAEFRIRSKKGARGVPFAEFWTRPKKGVHGDTVLQPGELIEAIHIPARDVKQYMGYYEVRHKTAFDWPLVSCAVRYELVKGRVSVAKVWFGSLTPIPWRARKAAKALLGKVCSDATAEQAADAALADATPLAGSAYKVKLAKVALKRALAQARGRS